MATIKNAITMQDRMSPVLNKMFKAMQSNLELMKQMDKASNKGITGKAFKQAKKDIDSANNALIKMQNNLIKSKQETEGLGNSFKGLNSSGLGLLNINAAIGIAQTMKNIAQSATNYLDTMTLTKARLDMINDGTQTTLALQDKIMASADRARMSYKAMGDNVARLNMLAKDQFKSNDEAIAFVETLNKMFVVSGASAEESTSAMYQLSQAMAAGKLQGDEFRSIMENAPMLADAIAKQVGKSKGELKELSSEGLITADIIKNAMFNYADEVEEKFSKMPMTFGQKMQQVSNKMMKKLEPVSNKFSEWLNSDKGSRFFDGLIDGVTVLANVAMVALEGISSGIGWVQDNIQYLLPFIVALGVTMVGSAAISAAAWTVANFPLLVLVGTIGLIIGILFELGITFQQIFSGIMSVLEAVFPLLMAIGTVALVLLIQKVWELVLGTLAWAAANALVHWQLILIVGIIALFIYILMQLGVTFDQVVGFIVGLLYGLAATCYNITAFMTNPFIIFANFLRNLFIDPIGAIKMLFLDMAEFVIDQILWVAKGLEDLINMIPFVEVNMTSGLENLSSMIKTAKEKVKDETGVKEANTMETMDVGEFAKKGYDKGAGFVNNFGSGLGGLKDLMNMDKYKPSGITIPDASSFGNNSIDKVGEVGKIKGDVSITDEDIKLLKDIAATKFINSYTTLRPDMKVEFSGPINETADINKLMEAIEEMTEEAVANVIVEEARVG
nr:MAG TPA_asm: Tail tape measure [Caudoviricetes sp.]